MNSPLVAVFMVTYNQENYIGQAIESVLMQKTTFPIKIIIGEDCSTDLTAAICTKYLKENPQTIEVIFNKENIGASNNAKQIFEKCFASGAKCIAMLEGDDYWTDPYKLQKQVDFLEENPDYSLCFHNSMIKHEDIKGTDRFFCQETIKDITGIEDVINRYYIPTASMVFRNSLIVPLPIWFSAIYNGDYALQLLLADKGKIKYLNEVMSVYRKQSGGLNTTMKSEIIWRHLIKLMLYFNFYTDFRYHELIERRINELFGQYNDILIGNKSNLQKVFSISFWERKINNICR